MTKFYIGNMEVSPIMYAEYLRELGLPNVQLRERVIVGNLVEGSKAFPIPYEQWPIWTKAVKLVSKPEDKGIGDTVARVIGDENSEAFAKWHQTIFNKPCGCKGRQARWNQLYPYE